MNHGDHLDSSLMDVNIPPREWTSRETERRHPGRCIMWGLLLRQILTQAPKLIALLVVIPIVVSEKKAPDKKDGPKGSSDEQHQ